MSEQQTSFESALDADSLPIKVTFVAGEIEIALSELSSVGPGYVFDLRLTPERHIDIRANGQSIGIGELVEVNGSLGVRILKCC